jgi:DNA-binding Lrp family transcriptional regulator
MARWTFLTNHALVLIFLSNNPRITGHELSRSVGITERAVRRIIADLDVEGYIKKQREGRRVKYTINHRLRFRHPAQRDKEIGILLEALGWKRESKRSKTS